MAPEPAFDAAVALDPRCQKPMPLCVCDMVHPIHNRVALLILQHPQEQDKLLGTARLAAQQFDNATFKVGLSWPSLAKALGREADPRRWATLFLGSLKPSDFPPGRDIAVFDRKGKAVAEQDAALKAIDGIVVVDGTWSQAKTLWWRNAWVLKGKRIALKPKRPSQYGRLRREPRREGLSTIEAAGMVLARVEGRPDIETEVARIFGQMLQRYEQAARSVKPARPEPARGET
jgi:DTW domain-containing protein YfiP